MNGKLSVPFPTPTLCDQNKRHPKLSTDHHNIVRFLSL